MMSFFTCQNMASHILVLVILTLTLGSVCGRVIVDNHVSGGVEAKVGAWPWVVSIRENGEHICGGTLIKPTFVLTTDRCTRQVAIDDMTVVLGLHDNLQPAEGLTEEITVADVIRYLDDIGIDEEFGNLALLRLKRPASKNKYISIATLADKGSDFTDEKCIIAGWGATEPDAGLSDALHQATLRVWSDRECKVLFPLKRDKWICAEGASAEKACPSDTGGPLMCPDKRQAAAGGHVVVGVGITQNCFINSNPSRFEFVPKYRDWIETNSQ